MPGPQSSNALAVGIPGTVYRTDGLTTARFSGRRNRCRAVDQLRCERTGAPETRTPASDALLRSCLISSARQKRCCALTRAGAPRLRPRCLPVALTPSSPRPRAPPPQSLSQDYPLSPASPRALRPPSRPTPLWVVPPPSRLLLWVGGKALAGNGWGEGWSGGGARRATPACNSINAAPLESGGIMLLPAAHSSSSSSAASAAAPVGKPNWACMSWGKPWS